MITSKNNDLIKYVKKISSKPKARREENVFFAEGRRLLSETPARLLKKVLVSENFSFKDTPADEKLKEILNSGADIEEVSESVFSEISDTKHSQGIAAVVRQPSYELSDLLPGKPLILLLENVQDPGNLGTMVRTALGAGASGIVMTRDCVDIFSPKVVRATMGAIYRLPFFFVDDASEAIEKLRGRVRFFAASLGGKKTYDQCDFSHGTAFLIGNEGNGLRKETISACDSEMLIPMEGGLESLNAAMAAGILLYEAHRQRHADLV
ncbi:MAG: RNA methyltransferase [Lachnospiraceae bacterium]|uniref:RNA methyltransferase n=1 Tax=Candidatus Weimeria bifida TaxID=2599074 RepID=A0A6N7J105_9FIRM|nr:RNA methyltransferase [Candidatus Weimeria bifida]RRF97339.1 MAG: RNA methyltransferase [Lachnospiraceae bacterium]